MDTITHRWIREEPEDPCSPSWKHPTNRRQLREVIVKKSIIASQQVTRSPVPQRAMPARTSPTVGKSGTFAEPRFDSRAAIMH